MSSCLILQAKDKLYIGADTSSSVFIDDKLYRLNNNTKKLFLLNANTVLYCAGNNSIAEKVVQYIYSIYHRNDFSLISLKNWLIEMYPYKNKDKTVYDVEILIATFKNNRTVVYQMSQYKNYDIISFEVSDAGVQILSAGIKNTECMSLAENELLNKSGVKSIFSTTFNNLSCNYIGGCLDLYEITKNGAIKIFDNEKINEHGIQYVHDVFNGLSVSLNAEVLVSKLVMSENLWIENDSGTYKFNDDGFIASSGKNSVKIQPNQSGELFSIYKENNKQFYINSDGDVEYAGTLRGATGIFSGLISGGEININNTFTVDKNGNMNSSSARISGEVNASSGTIGGWNINYNSLSSSNNSVFLSNDGTISGATITGANGEFTKGFKVNVNMPFALSLSGRGTATVDINNSQLAFGVSWSDNDFTGIKIDDESINFITIPHPASEYNSLEFITIDNQNLYNIITNMITDKVVKNTSGMDATYISSNYSSIGDNIIKFSNSTSKKAYAASCDYVQQYTSEKISGLKLSLSDTYAPKEHSHPKYTTESEVRSIVRSMVKSSALK